ncbi:MAG: hypothetical protein C5B50_20020 [Verrucomicrobia bacterium]|nr:MAG: hypothetical protein C5B50_20020 [Verrucomicrobiota bacterium]
MDEPCGSSKIMDDYHRLNDAELKALFDHLFPHGFAGEDVLVELACEGWEKSPLKACFHPSPEQVFEECLRLHRRFQELGASRRKRKPDNPELVPQPEPTLAQVQADWKDEPVNEEEEVQELVGRCLWDIFSDGHDVVASDGRLAHLGSFRGAGGFIADYVDGKQRDAWGGDYLRFYMGTSWISCLGIHERADLTPVYAMIFRRLKALGADWVYHFPELGLVDFGPRRTASRKPEDYSPSDAFAEEQSERERQAELERVRAELAKIHERSKREALDCPPPKVVLAYQQVFGRDPKGWPPV